MPAVPAIIGQRYDPHIPVDQLVEHPANPNDGDTGIVCESLDAHGFYGAVLVQESTGIVFAGNTRLRSARAKGMTGIPGFWCDVDDDTRDRILSMDNRATRVGRDDEARLVALLTGLAQQPRGLEGTGFDGDDLDALIAALSDGQGRGGPADGDPDDIPEPPAIPVTQPGDIWILGPHRIICDDAHDFGAIERLLHGERINLAFTSPPYADRRAYDETSGFRPVPPDEYVEWFETVQANVRAVIESDGSWFVNIKPGVTPDGLDTELYVLDLVIAHVRRWGWHFATEFCWERNGVPKSVTRRFKNQFEPVYQFTPGEWKMRPDAVRHWSEHVPTSGGPGVGQTSWGDGVQGAGTGRLDKPRKRARGTAKAISDVQGVSHDAGVYEVAGMAYPGNRLPTFAGTHQATGHAAAFPVGLPAWFIRAYSDPGDTVFDPFMGSGSTLIAAHEENRTAYGCEISAAYCDVICKRFEQYAGIKPERVLSDGTTEPVTFLGEP